MFKRPYYFVLSFSLKYNYIIFSSLLLPQIPLALAPFQSHSLFFFDMVIHAYRHTNTHIPKYLNTTCSDCLLLLMCIWFKSCSVDVSIRVGIPWSFSFCILTNCGFSLLVCLLKREPLWRGWKLELPMCIKINIQSCN